MGKCRNGTPGARGGILQENSGGLYQRVLQHGLCGLSIHGGAMSLAKMHSVTRRAGWGLVCASIAAVTIGTAVPASAAEVVLADLDRGVGCAFALKVVGTGDRVVRKFTDAAGNPVRELSTGKGFKLTFTNKDTGQR